ncbi:MAG: polysaccharide deacetylase family protein, partial [Elainella sp.]
SLLELAQDGNCRALTYWMNSLLGPQGVQVQVQPGSGQFLKILVSFRRPRRREACLHLRERLARFICYRLWTLNSDVIQGARIVARMAGDSRVLWQMSVRINSPAARIRRRSPAQHQLQMANQARFHMLRTLFMSSFTLVGFWIGYRLFYVEIGRVLAKDNPAAAPALNNQAGSVQMPNGQGLIRIPLPPSQTSFEIPKQAQNQVISQVSLPDNRKVIALTFDDGPSSEVTAQILDVLEQYKVQATFFMSGVNVEQQPELARRVVAEGHAVGNRGWTPFMETDQDLDPEQEIDQTTELIKETTGMTPELFRPANGQVGNKLVNYAKRNHYAVVLWSVDSQDSLVAAPIVLDNVLRNAQPGRIVLMHDGYGYGNQSATVQALPQMITALQSQGYRFVTVPKLLQMQYPDPAAEPSIPDAPDHKPEAQPGPPIPGQAQPKSNSPSPSSPGPNSPSSNSPSPNSPGPSSPGPNSPSPNPAGPNQHGGEVRPSRKPTVAWAKPNSGESAPDESPWTGGSR